MTTHIAIGVDFGGTKIRSGIVNSNGEVLFTGQDVPTEADKDRETVESRLFESIEAVIGHSPVPPDEILGIGIGSPGPLDLSTGTILNAPNLPSLNQYPLKQRVHNRFRMSVRINNDANCFVLGEAMFGSARGAGVVAGLTLGTGLGCGVVLNGQLFNGSTGTAAEIWCTPYAGKTFEEIVSSKGIQEMYRNRTGRLATAKDIAARASKKEGKALETWNEFGMHLGMVLSYLINLLDPDVIVIGGSIAKAYPYFQKDMEDTFRSHVNPLPREHVRITLSRIGDLAGLAGAAALCLE